MGGGGGLMRTHKREQTKEVWAAPGAMSPGSWEDFTSKSSEMAINASKTANSKINL